MERTHPFALLAVTLLVLPPAKPPVPRDEDVNKTPIDKGANHASRVPWRLSPVQCQFCTRQVQVEYVPELRRCYTASRVADEEDCVYESL